MSDLFWIFFTLALFGFAFGAVAAAERVREKEPGR